MEGSMKQMKGDGMEGDATAAVEALLVQTATAHGVFEETELQGVYDQGWPRWYATYAVEHGIGALVGHLVTIDGLAEFLATSNAEYERTEPEGREPWATYTARRISAEL
jgi:hypothetical protein